MVLDSELRARRAEDHAVIFRKELNAALSERESAVDDRDIAVANLESSQAIRAALVTERETLKGMVRQLVMAASARAVATTQPQLETLHAATQLQPLVQTAPAAVLGSKRKLELDVSNSADGAASSQNPIQASSQPRIHTANRCEAATSKRVRRS